MRSSLHRYSLAWLLQNGEGLYGTARDVKPRLLPCTPEKVSAVLPLTIRVLFKCLAMNISMGIIGFIYCRFSKLYIFPDFSVASLSRRSANTNLGTIVIVSV